MADILKKEDLMDVNVNASVLQELFGVDGRMIRMLAQQGAIERAGRGKYPLLKSVKRYITMLKVQSKGRPVQAGGDAIDLTEEKAKHEQVKRQVAEIKLQLIRGQVHKAEDVEAVMTDMFAKFKTKVEGLPSKLAKRLEGEDRVAIQKILQEELSAALEELSEYDPQDFYSEEYIDADDPLQDLLEGISDEEQEGSKLQDS